MTSVQVSIVLASSRPYAELGPTIASVEGAMSHYAGSCEVVVVRDSSDRDNASCWTGRLGDYSLKRLYTGGNRGSAYARTMGMDAASGDVILFTDDDVSVPHDWVVRMARAALVHGNCTGLIRSQTEGFWELCDECIDGYRVNAKDSAGRIKFMSFPTFAIRRDLLKYAVFLADRRNLADDVELSCTLRIAGIRINLDPTIVVHARYPSTFTTFLLRKVRHGIGVGRLQCRLGRRKWRELEMGSTVVLARRWLRLSGEVAPCHDRRRYPLVLAGNLAYLAALVISRQLETLHTSNGARLRPVSPA